MNQYLFPQIRVSIRGGGDLGSGVTYRLHKAGFPVLISELALPLLVRRAVAYGSAAVEGEIEVEGITAKRVSTVDEALVVQADGLIPVLVDPEGEHLPVYDPAILIDARLLKQPVEQPHRAPLNIGLGPGFTAGVNCDAAIETSRGHDLGRVIWDGATQPNTGLPGKIAGVAAERVLRSPTDGAVQARESIGALIAAGQTVAVVGGTPVVAPISGVLRGLVHDGLVVTAGTKIGDIDARGSQSHCFTISDKALAIGGGVLEAVLTNPKIQALITRGRDSG